MFLLTYDANSVSRNRAAEVAHFIFGRVVRFANGNATVEYVYQGFILRPGVLWVGQSVLLVTSERRTELAQYLSGKGVSHHTFPVTI